MKAGSEASISGGTSINRRMLSGVLPSRPSNANSPPGLKSGAASVPNIALWCNPDVINLSPECFLIEKHLSSCAEIHQRGGAGLTLASIWSSIVVSRLAMCKKFVTTAEFPQIGGPDCEYAIWQELGTGQALPIPIDRGGGRQ